MKYADYENLIDIGAGILIVLGLVLVARGFGVIGWSACASAVWTRLLFRFISSRKG
jgi:hypothetical protein